MQYNPENAEFQIMDLICQAELCFGICKSCVEKKMARGCGFLPFYYNLNFSKGLNILDSLLLSNRNDEYSIEKYIKDMNDKKLSMKRDWKIFREKICKIKKDFDSASTVRLRHKVVAHLARNYRHDGFINGYMPKDCLDRYIQVSSDLKKEFAHFCNFAPQNKDFEIIKEQSDRILSQIDPE